MAYRYENQQFLKKRSIQSRIAVPQERESFPSNTPFMENTLFMGAGRL